MSPSLWILFVLLAALLAVAVGLGLYLFVAVKKAIWMMERKWEKERQDLVRELDCARAAVGELGAGLRDVEEKAGMLVAPAPPPSGMNLNKRTQALRMSRRGEGPERIAAALGLSHNEIQLLLKVHRIVLTVT